MNIEERAKHHATSIIEWCLCDETRDREEDPNFVTNDIARAMRMQRIDDVCKLKSVLNSLMIDTHEKCAIIDELEKLYSQS